MASFKDEYKKIKHQIIASRNPNYGVAEFFSVSPPEKVEKYAPALLREAFFRNAIVGKGFPSEPSFLGACGNMSPRTSLKNALTWTTLGITSCIDTIDSFLREKDLFDHAFLWGQYDKGCTFLDIMTEKYGHSLWEIRARIALYNEYYGVEEQKRYLKDIVSKLSKRPVHAYLLNLYSRLCETKVSTSAYLSHVEREYDFFRENNLSQTIAKYIKYKTCGYQLEPPQRMDHMNPETLAAFLFYDDKNSMIDRYLSLRELMTSVFLYGDMEIQKEFFQAALFLSKKSNDPFWKNVVNIQNIGYREFFPSKNESICEVFDKYSIGDYPSCIEAASRLINDDINFFPLIEVLVKSFMFIGDFSPAFPEKSLIHRIANKVWDLFTMNGDIVENNLEGMKFILPHLDSAWTYQLTDIFDKQYFRMHSVEAPVLPNYYSSITTANDISSIPIDSLDEYIFSTPIAFRESIATKFIVSIKKNDVFALKALDIDPVRKQKYEAYLWMGEKNTKALDILYSIDCSILPLAIDLEIKEMLVECEFNCNNLQGALKLYTDAYFRNSNFIYSKFSNILFESIKNSSSETCSVLFPVFCDIYLKNHWEDTPGEDVVLSTAYEEFLWKLGISRPSELTKIIAPKDWNDYYTYFLSNVCVTSVMDRSLAFNSYDDVLKERSHICSELVRIAPEHAEQYENEINSITSSLLMQLAKREVEKGKIYVDIEGVKTILRKDVLDEFERYQEFRKHSIDELYIRLINATYGENDDKNTYVVYLKEDSLLEDIVKKARNVFVADNKYGLDGYLSVRIRHGTLESQLRSCFEKHKLITTKDISGMYQDNYNWICKKPNLQGHEQKVLSLFASFSGKIDEIINRVKKTLLQIKTENKNPEGLFDFTVSQNELYFIKSKLEPDASFDSFLAIIIQFFLDLTDANLERIRETFIGEIFHSFELAVNQLQTGVKEYSNIVEIAKLNDQLAAARTDIYNEIGKISEWFRFNRLDNYPDYQLSLASKISSDIIQGFDSSFILDASAIDESINLRGKTLVSIVEIFKILFDNIIKHSRGARKKATVSALRDSNIITINVSNYVSELDERRISDISSRLHQWETTDAISHEGGSGLLKIKKILSVDLKCKNQIEILPKGDVFSVRITADLKEHLL